MTAPTKLAISLLLTAGTVMVVLHGKDAPHPAIPRDMPRNAYFVQSGYDLDRNEATGNWIACSNDTDQNTNLCRVTDAHGTVIYQGDFLPLNGAQPVPDRDLKVASTDSDKMWVTGPAEAGPVPVIPLANGQILVPADDSEVLSARWKSDPDDLQRVEGQ